MGRTSACPSPYSAGKYAPTPQTVGRSFILANVVSKGGILPIFFFKNRGSILHYRLVHFNPRPNRHEQCQLHENYMQELLIFYRNNNNNLLRSEWIQPKFTCLERCLGGFNCAPSDFLFQWNLLHASFHFNRKYKFFIHSEGGAF